MITTEITTEIKAKLFAQCLGQLFIYSGTKDSDNPHILTIEALNLIQESEDWNEVRLILRALSSMTDEEKEQYFITRTELDYPLTYLTGAKTDTLRHAGFDVPNYLLDGKTLHEVGLAIYENEISI